MKYSAQQHLRMAKMLQAKAYAREGSETSLKRGALARVFEQLARKSYFAKPDFMSSRMGNDVARDYIGRPISEDC